MKKVLIAGLSAAILLAGCDRPQTQQGTITNADGTTSQVTLPAQDHGVETGILSGIAGFLLGRSMATGNGVAGGSSAVVSQPTTVNQTVINRTVVNKTVTVQKKEEPKKVSPPAPKPHVNPKPVSSPPKTYSPPPSRSYSSPSRSTPSNRR